MSEALYGSFKDFIFKKAVKFLRGRKALPKDVYMKLDDEARAKALPACVSIAAPRLSKDPHSAAVLVPTTWISSTVTM